MTRGDENAAFQGNDDGSKVRWDMSNASPAARKKAESVFTDEASTAGGQCGRTDGWTDHEADLM